MAAFEELMRHFPPVEMSFAYGSGVLQQAGYEDVSVTAGARDYSKLPMLDLVFAVQDPLAWHSANLAQNRDHYSALKYLGPGLITKIQEGFGAGIYYNTSVTVPDTVQRGRSMKYGVISINALKSDLLEWKWLYVAGRMQKPLQILKWPDELDEAARRNLENAVKVALLLLPESFSATELFTMVAGLSYRGDFRMTFGENPRKVRNIVEGNEPRFHTLYGRVLSAFPSLTAVTHDKSRFKQDMSPAVRGAAIRSLPAALLAQLTRQPRDWEGMALSKSRRLVKLAVHNVVARSSMTQGLKGVLTAGVFKAMMYSLRKVEKMLR